MSRLLKFGCPFRQQGCSRRFRSQAGRTYHIRTRHTNNNFITPPPSPSSHEGTLPEPASFFSEPLDSSSSDIPLAVQDRDLDIPEPRSSSHPALALLVPQKKNHPSLTGKFFFHNKLFSFVNYCTIQVCLVMRMEGFYLTETLPILDPIQTMMTGIHSRMRSNF